MKKITFAATAFAAFSILIVRAQSAADQNATLASTPTVEGPTMGWSSWNTFALNINESVIKQQAAAMKARGLLDVGYNHINIDDGYFGGRDSQTGALLIHKTRFPKGLKPVVDFIHSKGMKAGIYSDAGYNTCGSYHGGDKTGIGVGLYKHDQQDCDFFFKDCGFDFIKVDFCGGDPIHNADRLDLDEKQRYESIAKAIENTGRNDVRLNICRWAYPGNWAHDIAASWRTTGDINASWNSVKNIIDENLYLSAYCYGGHYNDMDMLEVGVGELSKTSAQVKEENRTHFGMWCIMSSPLLIGCDITKLTSTTLTLLKNEELIALNQDPLHLQAYVVKHAGDTYVLVKDIETLYGTTRAVAFYNPSDKATDMSVKYADLDLGGNVEVRDLYERKDIVAEFAAAHDEAGKALYTEIGTVLDVETGMALNTKAGMALDTKAGVTLDSEVGVTLDSEGLKVNVPAHGTRIYKLKAEKRFERMLYEAETAYLSKYQEIENNQQVKSAIYEKNGAASGGAYAGWLGGDPKNDLQWRNVYSDQGGDYVMTIKCLSGDTRNITVEVNGKKVTTLSYNSGGWNSVQSKSVKVVLEPGENKVRLYNSSSSAWMPNVDCMTIVRSGSSASDRVEVGIEDVRADAGDLDSAHSSLYRINGVSVSRSVDGNSRPIDGIYVKKNKKYLAR